MKELFEKILMYSCFAGLGGIALVALVWATLRVAAEQTRGVARNVRQHGLAATIAVAIFVCGMIVYGSTKNNSQANVTPFQLQRQVRALSAAPTNALARVEKWWRRGAFNDGQIVRFDSDWCFPYGTNHLTRVEVWATGAVYPSLKDPTPIAELATKLSLKPHDSEVFIGRTTNNTYRVEWHNGHPNRAHDQFADASIELFRNGNVIVTENGISTMIPYDIPFAHDGIGQDETWVRANFARLQALAPSLTNAEEILSVGYANWVAETVIANAPNGLFCLDVSFLEDPVEVTRLVVGDYFVVVDTAGVYSFVLPKGESHLIEMSFVPEGVDFSYYDAYAKCNASRPRQMMRQIASSQNIHTEIAAVGESGEVEIVVPDSHAISGHIAWKPSLSISPDHCLDPSYPILFYAFVDLPLNAYPSIHWASDDGSISKTGDSLLFDGANSSVRDITVTATCQGAILTGRISIRNVVAETWIDLSSPGVIVIEDPYTNRPNEVVEQTSNTVKMSASWELAQSGRLLLVSSFASPTRVCVGDNEEEIFSFPYEIGSFSQNEYGSCDFYLTSTNMNVTGDIGAYTLKFIPDNGPELVSRANIRIVKIRVEAESDWPSNKVRHVFGPKEKFVVKYPNEGYSPIVLDARVEAGEETVVVTNADFIHSIDYRVVQPISMRGEFVREMTDPDWVCCGRDALVEGVCGAGFIAQWYLEPNYVSFKGLWFQEGFARMFPKTGCFLDETNYPPSIYAHDNSAGAFSCVPIEGCNQVGGIGGCDMIAVQFGVPPEESGNFTLSIPQFWGVDSLSCTNRICTLDQIVIVDGVGTTTISKGSLRLTRNALE